LHRLLKFYVVIVEAYNDCRTYILPVIEVFQHPVSGCIEFTAFNKLQLERETPSF
jgi:hypothetical protein